MRTRFTSTFLAGLALAGVATFGIAQIETLDLPAMVQKADSAVFGTITDRQVVRFDHEVDGTDLFYTHLTIQGHDLATNEERTVVVTLHGGFLDERVGVYNSEAPPADAILLGKRVVAFYAYTDNMGGDLAANSLYASHGGLYQSVTNRAGQTVVLGQGPGYAIDQNVSLTELQEQIAVLSNGK